MSLCERSGAPWYKLRFAGHVNCESPRSESYAAAKETERTVRRKRTTVLFLAAALIFAVCFSAGCAARPNPLKDSPAPDGSIAGFWLGLWHGMILPVTFVISLFAEKVSIYEVYNNGRWYNFGYLLGAAMVFSGGVAASREDEEEEKEENKWETEEAPPADD